MENYSNESLSHCPHVLLFIRPSASTLLHLSLQPFTSSALVLRSEIHLIWLHWSRFHSLFELLSLFFFLFTYSDKATPFLWNVCDSKGYALPANLRYQTVPLNLMFSFQFSSLQFLFYNTVTTNTSSQQYSLQGTLYPKVNKREKAQTVSQSPRSKHLMTEGIPFNKKRLLQLRKEQLSAVISCGGFREKKKA